MSTSLTIEEKLKEKYHKCEEVTNFKDMLDRSATIFKTRTAFKLKDENGNIYNKTYEELKTIQDNYSCPLETMKKILANYPEETRKDASIFIINYPLAKEDFVGRFPNEETLIYLRNKLGLL